MRLAAARRGAPRPARAPAPAPADGVPATGTRSNRLPQSVGTVTVTVTVTVRLPGPSPALRLQVELASHIEIAAAARTSQGGSHESRCRGHGPGLVTVLLVGMPGNSPWRRPVRRGGGPSDPISDDSTRASVMIRRGVTQRGSLRPRASD